MVIPQERRRYPRARARWPVTIETTQGIINTETHDISLDGAFIRCLDPLGLDEIFTMIIRVPHSDRRLAVDSEIVWINAHGPDYTATPRGMGVQFGQINKSDRQFLDRVILDRL